MAYQLPLTAVGDAVFARFQDPGAGGLDELLPGGVQTDVPQNPAYPFLWFEVLHQQNYGGLGTQPGRGSMPGVTLRLHVFNQEPGTMRDSQLVLARAINLLFPDDDNVASLVLDGYMLCSDRPLPEIESIPLPFEELNGVKVSELVTNIDLIVEELAA
jgi:hypothetical protein